MPVSAPPPSVTFSPEQIEAGNLWKIGLAAIGRGDTTAGRAALKELTVLAETLGDQSILISAMQLERLIAQGGIRALNFMGTMGCGKSKIAAAFAQKYQFAYRDADEFHSDEARAKMGRGQALSDSDRIPFLRGLQQYFAEAEKQGRRLSTCSALRQKYRRVLQGAKIENSDEQGLSNNIKLSRLDLVFIQVSKPFEIALRELNQAATAPGKERTLLGKRHYAEVRIDNPQSVQMLRDQYEKLEQPKPWEALVIDTQEFYHSDSLSYDQAAILNNVALQLGYSSDS